MLVSAGLGACGDDHGDESAELQAILRDGDLTNVMRNMLLSPPPPMTGTAGSRGGMVGTGGTTGGGGSGPAGTTGRGGTTGVAGTGMPPGPGTAGTGTPPGPGAAGSGMGPGSAGTTGMGGTGMEPPLPTRNLPGEAQGFWRFDDCFMERTELFDSSFSGGHTAYRSVTAFCREGVLNQAIGFDEDDDLILVPDQPNFVFSEGFTVAAWVKPLALGGVRTIFRKRQEGTSTFVLVENGNRFQVVINLANGRAADVSAPATLDKVTHVAATYDGIFLKLYLDGVEAASRRVVGRLSDGVGPLLMGNDANLRRIDGIIDHVVFDTLPSNAAEIRKLNCLPRPSEMVVTPTDPAAVPTETPVNYDVALTNNSCEDAYFNFSAFPANFNRGIVVDPSFGSAGIQGGTTVHLPFSVRATEDNEEFGTSQIIVNGDLFTSNNFESFSQAVNFSVIDNSTPCTVRSRKELAIRDVSVVDDPIRTGPNGAWSFGKLMENMAPTPAQAPAMVEAMLRSFLVQQTVNSFPLPPRLNVQRVLDSLRGPTGALDLTRPAFRLLAIVNRIDLHDATATSATTAGEGRFVFGFAPFGQTLQATLIIEYNIPASSRDEVLELANAWHALKDHMLPSPEYNAALQAVTDVFTSRGAAPGRPNESALGQIRTNDFFALGNAWEFREFHLDATTGMLVPAPVAQTPDRSFNFTPRLTNFVIQNEAAIFTEKHVVPLTFEGAPFQGGAVDASNFFTWQVPGVNPELRHFFARNTCNGCHTFSETAGDFFQIRPRFPFQEAPLSGFLLGGQVDDFQAGVTRHFNELRRRGRILHDLVCPDEILPPLPPATTPIGGGTGTGGSFGSDGGMPPPPPPRGGTGIGGSFGGTGVGGTGGPITGIGGAGGGPITDGGISTGGGGARGM